MNRVGVITGGQVNDDTVGSLFLYYTGENKDTKKPNIVDLSVILRNKTTKSLGWINPRHFEYEVKPYVGYALNNITLGYVSPSGNLVCVDPALPINLNKFGTITINVLKKDGLGYTPKWGLSFSEDIYIQQGDTLAKIYQRLLDAAHKVANKVYYKFPESHIETEYDITSANKYIKFLSNSEFLFNVTLDGIFDGTLITNDINYAQIINGTYVIAREKEGAILDGYNPNQTDKFQTFNLSNYILGEVDNKYDSIIIRTTSDEKYESPTFHGGWDLEIELYCLRNGEDDGTLGVVATAVVAELKAISDKVKGNVSVEDVKTLIAAVPHQGT